MTVCPCGTTTGHGESCSGTDPLQWCESCAMLYRQKMRAPSQIRTMDELDAGRHAEHWMQSVIYRLVPKHSETARAHPDWRISVAIVPQGRLEAGTKVATLWNRDRPRAMYILQRDSANFTIATMIEVEPPA